jgi:hypothetical protein
MSKDRAGKFSKPPPQTAPPPLDPIADDSLQNSSDPLQLSSNTTATEFGRSQSVCPEKNVLQRREATGFDGKRRDFIPSFAFRFHSNVRLSPSVPDDTPLLSD